MNPEGEGSETGQTNVAANKAVDQLERIFTYHPPKNDQAERYEALHQQAKDLARSIVAQTPVSREQSLALTSLQQAVMWTNAAIACNEE